MCTRFVMRQSALGPLLTAAAAMASVAGAAPPTPGWSSQFANAGFVLDPFLDGPTCLLPFQTIDGPRLFVGGGFTAIQTPGSATPTPYQAIAVWDGVRWSAIASGGVPLSAGAASVQAITTMPIGGVPRVVLAGFFDAPQTQVGIGYLDDARVLHPLSPGPISHAWFGSAFGWTPPGGQPEVVVTSGIFPQGSDYAYRYTQSGVALLPPGIITVTTAFAVFDDGVGPGPALFIGAPTANGGFNNKLSRWDGSTLTSVNAGTMTWVNALCVHDDGSGPALYAAGHGFRRLRAGQWEAVSGPGAPTFNMNALASFDDGSGPALYVAGQFATTTNGANGTVTATNIVRLRNGVWEALGSGLTGGVPKAMAVFDEDGPGPRPVGLFVVGGFTTAGGASSIGVARWGVPVCRADADGDWQISPADVAMFVSAWFGSLPTGTPAGDFDGNGAVQPADIAAFVTAWQNALASGC